MRDRAAQALRALLNRFAEEVDADAVAILWDGTRVPLDRDGREGSVVVRFNDPGAIAAVVRRPSLVSLFEVVARGLIAIEDISPLEAVRAWDHIRVVRFAKKLGPTGLARALWPFLLLPAIKLNGCLAFDGGDDAKQVQHHYDVSNDFYRLFLDERMVYSCGYFEDETASLDQAQRAKLDISCRKLRLREGGRLLDIGCGWGGLAIHAAENYGVRVVGVTLAEEQFALAKERVAERGLSDRIDIRLADYRGLRDDELFDAIVQIGMYEHVSAPDQTPFFGKVKRLLGSDGVYLHHAIVRRKRNAGTKVSPYFKVIDRFVFPGTELDHIGRTMELMELSGLEPHDTENWRFNYARTCREWSERLWNRRLDAASMAGEDVTRMWLLYLAMVTVGFERGVLAIHQTVCTHRRHGQPPVPLTRADLYRTEPTVD